MNILAADFIDLLPSSQRGIPAAKEEAAWLARRAYSASAELAREYNTVFIGWFNNILVNTSNRERGLCWQYQRDLYRELTRRPLKYFHVGMAVRDQADKREHNCVYINRLGGKLPSSLILDPWIYCGHMQVVFPEDHNDANWTESPIWEDRARRVFEEGHDHSKTHRTEDESLTNED